MKTYKTFGIVAAVWAALACSVTLTTSAADGEGDIWYIGRADGGTYGLSTPLSMDADNNSALPGQPKVLTAGQEVWFRFRLLNRNYYDKYARGITGPIDWYLKYNGPNNTNAAPPMKVGVWVSGQRLLFRSGLLLQGPAGRLRPSDTRLWSRISRFRRIRGPDRSDSGERL